MERDTNRRDADTGQESRLDEETEERLSMEELVPDGLDDEANVDPDAHPPDEQPREIVDAAIEREQERESP